MRKLSESSILKHVRNISPVEGKRGVQGQKLDFLYFFTVKSSTLDGIITFYRIKISSHALQIQLVKVQTYFQIYRIFNTIENMSNFHLENLINLVEIAHQKRFFAYLQTLIIEKTCRSRNFDFFLFFKSWPSKIEKSVRK